MLGSKVTLALYHCARDDSGNDEVLAFPPHSDALKQVEVTIRENLVEIVSSESGLVGHDKTVTIV